MSPVAEFDWVIPNSLMAARKRLGLDRAEVADQAKNLGGDYAGITSKSLEAWENGNKEPELRHLEALSEIYVCPVGWFFLPRIPDRSLPLSFRGVSPESKVGANGMQTISRFLELADWAEDAAIRTGHLRLPDIGRANLGDDIDRVAARERHRLGFDDAVRLQWETDNDAFEWWRRRIEGLGVFCFLMRLPASEVRGACYAGKRGGAFVLVNSEDGEAATGRIFTLLHEYAHLILRESSVCDFRGSRDGAKLERFANRFAARMLLDRSELTARLQAMGASGRRDEWGDSIIDRIREPFRVSRDVIAIYLEELELAPKGFYAKRRAVWGKRRGFGRSKKGGHKQGIQRLRMVGGTLARVLSSKEAESALSVLDLAEALNIKVERVPEVLDTFRTAGAEA